VLAHDFPLNDGGLFFAMVKDITANGFRTPLYTSYNHAQIPFVYPPLGLYVAAIFGAAGIPLLGLFRFMPAALSAASVPAAYGLAQKMLGDRLAAAFAAWAVAILPESFHWRIMGGGITRSFGFLFGLLTLNSLIVLMQRPSRKVFAATCIFGAATVLSHPEATVHFALGGAVLLVFKVRDWKKLAAVLTAGVVMLILSAVWWLPAVRWHGFGPWLGAMGSRDIFTGPVLLLGLVSKLDALTLVFALVGMITGRRDRVALLLTFGIAMFILVPRGANQVAILVVAMLFGLGARVVIEAILAPLDRSPNGTAGPAGWRRPSVAALGMLLLFNFVPNWTAMVAAPNLGALTVAERQAMDWARLNTKPESVFLVVEGRDFFAARTSEWFPALAGRRSGAAVQGYEWKQNDDFRARTEAFRELQACGEGDSTCIRSWAAARAVDYDYIFVVKNSLVERPASFCCRRLNASLQNSAAHSVAFENPDVAIYRRNH
jgi:hypothetical protein